ncbi:MAG: hypothetical protein AAF589_09205, partial [Planctomycetota bacterium]
MLIPSFACRLALVAACLPLLMATVALGQNTSDVYALRQELRNDSYVWESMLTGNRPTKAAPLVNPGARTPAPPAAYATSTSAVAPLTGTARSVLNYYGSAQAAATLQQMPRRRFISNGGQSSRPAQRPFARTDSGPTVSPYLNLFRDEDDEAAPNYYAFVRPQQRQIEANRRQQAELSRLQRRVNAATTAP